jgi:hypothetical protein
MNVEIKKQFRIVGAMVKPYVTIMSKLMINNNTEEMNNVSDQGLIRAAYLY